MAVVAEGMARCGVPLSAGNYVNPSDMEVRFLKHPPPLPNPRALKQLRSLI
jgi:hypothetical protein